MSKPTHVYVAFVLRGGDTWDYVGASLDRAAAWNLALEWRRHLHAKDHRVDSVPLNEMPPSTSGGAG